MTTAVPPVTITDTPVSRVRQPANLVGMMASALGIILVLVIAAYAYGTTTGVTDDVRSFGAVLGQILAVPVNILEGLVVIGIPVAVLIELAVRRLTRQVLNAIIAFALGAGLAMAAVFLIAHLGTDAFIHKLSVPLGDAERLTIPAFVSACTGLLVSAGPRRRRTTVRWSSTVLLVAVLVLVVTAASSLPGMLTALLLGAFAGHATQYVMGVTSERAYGQDLVEALTRLGFAPSSITRVERHEREEVSRRYHCEATRIPLTSRTQAAPGSPAPTPSPAAPALDTPSATPTPYTLLVLDGDLQAISLATRLWRAIRFRGVDLGAGFSLKSIAERNALLLYAAHAAGLDSPQLLGFTLQGDSAVLVVEDIPGATPLRELDTVTDAWCDHAWEQLTTAHAAGLVHRRLSEDRLYAAGDRAILTGWDQGETAATLLSERLDLAQLLTVIALKTSPERALASAQRNLDASTLVALGPLLQAAALPASTNAEVRRHQGFMKNLREALTSTVPDVSVEPTELFRFSPKTIIMTVMSIVAVVVVITTINLAEITAALHHASPGWIALAFGFAVLPWLGAAMALIAFAPGRLPLGRSVLVQMASSFIALAAPAGIGPAGVNLRYMTRRKISLPQALATTALVQVAQITVTVIILLTMVLTSGQAGLVTLPSGTMLLAVGVILGVVAILMAIPNVRRWAWKQALPTLQQLRPRLMAALSQPTRLVFGLVGNVLHALAYVFSFYAVLYALGHPLPLVDAAVIYLVGNTVGALIPTPGGVGGVEGALIAGLSAAGIPAAIGVSATIVFRVVSYWVQIPMGWVAMRFVERAGDI
ncbi:MAG: flippase-like domain-containing protein [Cellulomonadaceae bacterium]|jgi:uncharacterized protein (TIRG00374 family)|nr:flippase-like domain-containing protein [Cellulomonadaceae bacterium]